MKAKKIIITVALVSMGLFMAACAKSSNPTASTDTTATSATADTSSTTGNTQANNNRGPRRRPDLYGQVEKIIGNEVTLKVAEMPKRTARPAGASGTGGQRGQQGGGQQADALAGASSTLGGSTGGGQGGQGGGGGFRGQGGGGWPGAGGSAPTIKYTGQVDKVIIPVGVPITSMKRSTTGGKPTQAQLNISEITEGTMLQIYYAKAAAGEAKIVESVRVIPARQN